MVDEALLSEAVRLCGSKTYSAVVARALAYLVQNARARRILELEGSGSWDGDLAAMRRDTRAPSRRAEPPGRARRRARRA